MHNSRLTTHHSWSRRLPSSPPLRKGGWGGYQRRVVTNLHSPCNCAPLDGFCTFLEVTSLIPPCPPLQRGEKYNAQFATHDS